MGVCITRDHGMLKVNINNRLYTPLSFKSFRPNPQNVSEFYQAGVRLFSVLSSGIINALGVPYSLYGESWVAENAYDFSAIDRQMEMFLANAPEGYFAPMFQIDTRPWYLEKHPEMPNSFTNLSHAAYDAAWKKAAADYLKAAIRHCEEVYGDRIYGYFLLGGMTTEWLAHPDKEASHPLKEAGYRAFMGDQNAKLPSLAELSSVGSVFLEEKEDNVRSARRFHSETVSELLLYFAKEAQSVLHHKKLLGAYFGYLLHLGGEFLYNAGHLDYERVFLSEDIDMISSPSEYKFRGFHDPSGFMVTQKTLDAHGKLYFLEFDHITHVAPTMIQEPCADPSGNARLLQIPGAKNKCKNEEETLNIMWRDFLLCYANGAAMWWFDMFDGWFRTKGMMDAVSRMIALHTELQTADKSSVAQIAVYAEGEAMYHVRKTAKIATVCLSDMRRTLAELGAPYDLYSIADLDRCDPKQYPMIILLNAYDIPDDRMQKIRALQSEGATVLWFYAPDYAHGGKTDVTRISQAVGMEVRESQSSHGALLVGTAAVDIDVAAPYFSIAEDAEILARFADGTAAVAAKGNSVYAALPFLPSQILRTIAKRQKIHLYSSDPLVYTYVNAGALCVYNATEEDAILNVCEDGLYIDRLTDTAFLAEKGQLRLPAGRLRAYLLMKQDSKHNTK